MSANDLTDLAGRFQRRAHFEYHKVLLERDVARLMHGFPPITTGGGPRVGMATFGSGEWHLTLDLLLAHALALRGADPRLLVCDLPDLPICDERTVFSRHQERCDGCLAAKHTLLETSQLAWAGLSMFVAPDAIAEAAARVARVEAGALEGFEERGWPIGQWLHVSGCHFLRGDARGSTAEKVATRRRWLATAIVVVHAVERWLDGVNPAIVMVQGGAHVRWRITRELAQARGIPVISREMGKGGWDRHLYALNADCMAPNLDAAWAEARGVVLTAAEDAEVDRLIARLPDITHPPVAARTPHRSPVVRARRTAVAFTNVTWDLATAGRDVAFDGVADWLRDTIRALEGRSDIHLIVRAHPAEAATDTRERILAQLRTTRPEGQPNVTLIEPEESITAPELLATADLVLVYNSTAGLEAAANGLPVIVCGAPHYSNRGFTIDISTRDDYRATLHRWAAGTEIQPPPMTAALARRYFSLFFTRYTIHMNWTTSPLTPPYRLTIESIDELRPGRNPALDAVCAAILDGRQVVLPRRQQEPSCAV
jgi:hypothetical protein